MKSHVWRNPGNGYLQASTRKPVMTRERQRNNRHDLHSKTASREMPGTECGLLHDPCRPHQSICHSQSWGTLEIMAKFDCPAKFMAMLRQFHDGMLSRLKNDGEFSDLLPATNGVKQGCVLASTLFSMMFSAMLTDAFQDDDNGIPIRYRFDGKLFNLQRLQVKSKVQTEVLDEFLSADDMTKAAPTEEKNAKRCGSSIRFMWQLWSHKQLKKDWGSISASTWKALQGAYHHSERSTTASSRQVHLPWKHTVKSCAHWWQSNARIGWHRGSIWDRSGNKAERPHKWGCWWIRSKKNQRSRTETCAAESQS